VTTNSADAGQGSRGAPRKLLIVDSSTDALLRSLLETSSDIAKAGVECVSVRSAAEALARVEEIDPVMIVIDPACATTSCYECTELGVRAGTSPLVLLVSDDTPAESIEVWNRSGASDCILRPFRVAQVVARLSAVLEQAPASPLELYRRPSIARVLLAGPDDRFQRRLARSLEQSGYQVLACSTIEEVSALSSADMPHLVLLGRGVGSLYAEVRDVLSGVPGAPPVTFAWLHRADLAAAPSAANPGEPWFEQDGFTVEDVLFKVQAHFRRTLDNLRVHERVPFFCPVEVREIGATDPSWSSCYSYDLSPGGIFLKTLVPPRLRASVELKIHLTTMRLTIDGTGVVAWSNPYKKRRAWSYPVGAGIQFLGMSPKRLGQLREICEEASRFMPPEDLLAQ
jgi:DNA-binding response OmpR family regulator